MVVICGSATLKQNIKQNSAQHIHMHISEENSRCKGDRDASRFLLTAWSGTIAESTSTATQQNIYSMTPLFLIDSAIFSRYSDM